MRLRRKKWTKKQLQEKIKDLKSQLNYKKRAHRNLEEEIRDLEVLLNYYEKKLAEKHDNPSSVDFGAKK